MRGLTKENCRVGQVWKIGLHTFKVIRLYSDSFTMEWDDGIIGNIDFDYENNKNFTLVLNFKDYYGAI